MTLYYNRLDPQQAKNLLNKLDDEFGLVWANDFCVTGNTITASMRKDYAESKNWISGRFGVTVSSTYFTESTIKDTLHEFEPFRATTVDADDYDPYLNRD